MSNKLGNILAEHIKEMTSTGVGAYVEPNSGEAVATKKSFKKKYIKEENQELLSEYVEYVKNFENLKFGDIAKNEKVGLSMIEKGKILEEKLKNQEDSKYWKLGSSVYKMYEIIEEFIDKIKNIKNIK